MSARWPIPRPTENAALRAVTRTPRPLPAVPALFAALLDAYVLQDRRGVNLAAHGIARTAGANDACVICGYWRCRCFEKNGR